MGLVGLSFVRDVQIAFVEVVAADALHQKLEPAVLLLPARLIELVLAGVEHGCGALIGKVDALVGGSEDVPAPEAARAIPPGGCLSLKDCDVERKVVPGSAPWQGPSGVEI